MRKFNKIKEKARKLYLEFVYWLAGKESISLKVKHIRITWLLLATMPQEFGLNENGARLF